jgi:hypothetical protein
MDNLDLIQRQQELLVRSAHLRRDLADQSQILQRPFAVVDSARSGLQWLRRNPQWPLAALTLVVLVRPRRAMVWGGRLWWAWKTVKGAQDWLARLPTR